MKTTLGCLVALLLSACSTSLEGDWRGENHGCGRDALSLDGSLHGDGTLSFVNGSGSCLSCDFQIEGESRGSDRFTFDIDFDTCTCAGDPTAEADCELNDAGDKLTCTLDFGNCSPSGDQEFELRF